MFYQGLGPSLCLTLPAFFLSVGLAILVALFSTYRPYSARDKFINFFCLALMSISFLSYVIVFQYFFAFKWSLFPVNGWNPGIAERWSYLILPWFCIIVVQLGPLTILFRSSFFNEAEKNYVRTAQAKGVDNQSLYSKHILKNAISPIITICLTQLPVLITGNLVLESFFGIPGIGGLLIQAMQNADFPTIKAFTVLISLIYLFSNLFADVLLSFADPRLELK